MVSPSSHIEGRWHMGPYILAKNFTFVLADGQTFRGDWVPIDPQFQKWLLNGNTQTLEPPVPTNGVLLKLEISYDQVNPEDAGSTNITGIGPTNTQITQNMLGWVRMVLINQEGAAMSGTISVWLQPKSD
jgi:hypothetical protein